VDRYGTDLSGIHHAGFGAIARAAGPAIVRRLRRAGIGHGLVVDLGCGSGILARSLMSRGYDVLGVDASAAMLAIARRVAPRARFVHGSAEAVPLPRCRAIVATGEALSYLGRHRSPDALLRRHVRRAARALEPGGIFVFDVVAADPSRPMRYRTWQATSVWAVLVDVEEDLRRRVITRRLTTFARAGRTFRRSTAVHRVGVHDPREVLRDLAAHGFEASTAPSYGASPLPPRRVVIAARLIG
jgi:SAM-dependent methyltransferase